MAITSNCSKFLFYAKSLGADFSFSLTLGRLNLYASKKDIEEQIRLFHNNAKSLSETTFKDGYSEPLFGILGAQKTDSLDFSDYEHPSIVHDLNQPIPDALKEKYTAIVDGGTLEHVFNFPVAIRNCMEMLKVGGHYIGITPVNNLMGHGFYQFSPELYYTVFNDDNGFSVVKVILCTYSDKTGYSDWYEVVNPREIRSRVMFTNAFPTYLLLLAQKNAVKEIFHKTPQQSDYESLWAAKKSLQENKALPGESRIRFFARKLLPLPVKKLLHNIQDKLTKRKIVEEGFGEIDPAHFKKIKFDP